MPCKVEIRRFFYKSVEALPSKKPFQSLLNITKGSQSAGNRKRDRILERMEDFRLSV